VNRKITNTAIGRDVYTAWQIIHSLLCHQHIAARCLCESAALGQSVLEVEPNGAAAQEIMALTRAAVEMMTHAEKNRLATATKTTR